MTVVSLNHRDELVSRGFAGWSKIYSGFKGIRTANAPQAVLGPSIRRAALR